MALHLIIDGYNLIRASAALARQERIGLDLGRSALLHRLASYRRIKPHPVTVVFDAGRGPGLKEFFEYFQGIKVIFSSAGETADTVIIRLARKYGSQALVVTSDQALARAVEAAGAAALPSPEFEARMETAYYQDFKDEPVEEDSLEISPSTRKKGPARRASKSARRRDARLNKL